MPDFTPIKMSDMHLKLMMGFYVFSGTLKDNSYRYEVRSTLLKYRTK